MAEKKEIKTNKRRTQVKELSKDQKELSKDEQKKVKGGSSVFGFEPQPISAVKQKQ